MRLRGLRQLGTGLGFLLAAAFAVLAPFPADADMHGPDLPGGVPLSFRVERDVPPDATIEAVCCTGAYGFAGPERDRLTMGFGEGAAWFRIELAAGGGLVQMAPVLDDVTLYARAPDGAWRIARSGDQIALGERSLVSPFMALPVPDDIADPVVFVRVLQSTAITIGALRWDPPAFAAMQAEDRAVKTFLLGFICAMILFNGIVWALVRDLAFLLNACTTTGLLLVALNLSGYGPVHFWAALPGWSNTFFFLGLLLTLTAGSAFMWIFMRAPGEAARRGWPLLGPGLAAAAAGAAHAAGLPYHLAQPWLLVCAAALLFGGGAFVVARALRGDGRARILLAPLLLAILPGLTLVALDKLLGVRPFAIGNHGLEVALCLEAALFSLALTSRIRLTEIAAREASARLLALREESAARVIAAQDAERRRLASELHDGAGQGLLLVLNGLKRLSRSGPPGERETAARLTDTTAAALDDLRRISRDMHPAAVEHLGLGRALEGLFEPLARDGIDIGMEIGIDEAALCPEAKLHVYRIAQECAANTVRHAGATRISVSMRTANGALLMVIEDDGIGLPPPEGGGAKRPGLGFTSIAERVRMLGGRWTAGDGALGGLAVRVSIPIARHESEA